MSKRKAIEEPTTPRSTRHGTSDLVPKRTAQGKLIKRSDDVFTRAALTKNNLLATASRQKGVTTSLSHAWFSYNKDGLTYLYNGNDGQGSIDGTPNGNQPKEDGSPNFSKKIIRVLIKREAPVLQIPTGVCMLVSTAFSHAYYKIFKQDHVKFNAWALQASESDCYFLLTHDAI